MLEAAVARAAAGTGAVVLIGAEAGMGKSRLVAEVGRLAAAAGATMLICECPPLGDGELPYAPIVSALRTLLRVSGADMQTELDGVPTDELARLLPEFGRDAQSSVAADAPGSPARLYEQLLNVFARAARDAPVVLAVEDVHWSDRSTRDFLAFLVRGIRRERLALILTYRGDEIQRGHPARPFLLELERSGQAIRMELHGFGRRELLDQVTGILDHEPAPDLVDSLLDRAEGNPFFTEELLATLAEPEAPLPESLREAILFRIEGSSDQVRTVLQVAAVAGREVDHSLLGAVAGLEPASLLEAVRDAVQSYLLVENPRSGAYRFRHALLREAVYTDLLLEDRRALHLQIAQALGASQGPPNGRAAAAELAHHWYAAGKLPEALEASIEAGLEAESLRALGEALAHYERALELWGAVDPSDPQLSRVDVVRRAAEAASVSGHIDRSIALARETLERTRPDDPVAVALAHERLGRYLWTAGRGEESLPEYQRAVELMPTTTSRERALVLAAEAQVLMLCNYNEQSVTRCEEALQVAEAVGAEDIKAHVLNTVCANLSYTGELEQAVATGLGALEVATRLGLTAEIGRAFVNASDSLDQAGRVRDSIALARRGVDTVSAMGLDRQNGDFLRAEIAGRLLRLGEWDEAEALLAGLIERASPGVNSGLIFERLAELHAERGDLEAARRALDRADDNIVSANGSMWLAPVAGVRATVELWNGDPESALRGIYSCIDQFSHGEYVFFTARLHELGIRAHADLCLLAPDDDEIKARESERARELLTRLDRVIAKLMGEPQPRVVASRAGAVAELSRLTGPDAEAWQQAERLAQTIGDEYKVAYARWRRAEALIHDGDAELARAPAQQAFATADQLGAKPLRDAVDTLARAARIRLDSDEVEPDEIDSRLDRFDLTTRELEVLALLGEGMTNREIAATLVISEKTASVHVSRILAKLSVANRASAAVLAQRLGAATTK